MDKPHEIALRGHWDRATELTYREIAKYMTWDELGTALRVLVEELARRHASPEH